MSMLRIGHGYDLHRLTADRRLIIGGAHIPYEKGLSGHSDADVLTHAICDSILGAAGLGGIGRLFPDTDDAYKNADSLSLLSVVIGKAADRGYSVSNIDATIIAQAPKMAAYIPQMQKNIAVVCKIQEEQINIKATTEEGLGPTGIGEAISAHAVVLLVKK